MQINRSRILINLVIHDFDSYEDYLTTIHSAIDHDAVHFLNFLAGANFQILPDINIDINANNRYKQIALHRDVSNLKLDFVRISKQIGVNTNIKDRNGKTALDSDKKHL